MRNKRNLNQFTKPNFTDVTCKKQQQQKMPPFFLVNSRFASVFHLLLLLLFAGNLTIYLTYIDLNCDEQKLQKITLTSIGKILLNLTLLMALEAFS